MISDSLITLTLKVLLWLLHTVGVPSIVCLCGSTRFYDEFRAANLRETLEGRIVLSIGCDTKSDTDLFGRSEAQVKPLLDWLHKKKIDLADEVLVLNRGGYIGSSTASELAHARRRRKRIRWLEKGGAA